MRKDCPQARKEEPKQSNSLTPAKVFTLTQTEAEASSSVVSGQNFSVGSSFTALIDSGATHSFVSTRVIDELCRPSDLYARDFRLCCQLGNW